MRLISRSHYLVLVISEKTWVGFDEHGKYAGTDPYIADEVRRHHVINKARDAAGKVFWHETRSGDT